MRLNTVPLMKLVIAAAIFVALSTCSERTPPAPPRTALIGNIAESDAAVILSNFASVVKHPVYGIQETNGVYVVACLVPGSHTRQFYVTVGSDFQLLGEMSNSGCDMNEWNSRTLKAVQAAFQTNRQ